MKLIFTLFLTSFLFTSLLGQYGLNPEVILMVSDGDDIEVKVDITNNTGEYANIYWMCETDENYPKEWGTIICDAATCYGEDTFKSNPNLPNEMEAGGSFVFKFSISAKGTAGSTYVIMHLYDDTECENEVATSNPPALSVEEEDQERLSVFPNPTQDYFSIQNDENVNSIDIINSIGQILISAPHERNKTHSVERLESGTFIVVLKNSEEEIIKSLYLFKD